MSQTTTSEKAADKAGAILFLTKHLAAQDDKIEITKLAQGYQCDATLTDLEEDGNDS